MGSITNRDNRALVIAFAALSFIALFVFLSLRQQGPPDVVDSSAALTNFSSGRAMERLRLIAQKPHPIGSSEHDKVRDNILEQLTAIGLNPEIQKTTAVNQRANSPLFAGTVENILASLKGTADGKAIMLVGHYDSVPTGPGASDDGSAVAAMLETARALKASPPLMNDVIFLFTDGEETGLLGAKAFVEEHPRAKDVGLVLNFEARGNSGPAIMFETSPQNGWLIGEFAKAVPYPVANSLSYEIYKRMPNDTDLTVFKKAGLPGLNFAYIDGLSHYHTQLDSIENVDERSVQHQGSYALSLTRHFGNLNLEQTPKGNAIYFNAIGFGLIHYSGVWATPLMALVLVLLVAVVALGFRKRRLTRRGLVAGFLAFLASMVTASIGVTLVWWIIRALPLGQIAAAYHSSYYVVAFVSLAIAISSSLYIAFRRKAALEDLAIGALLWWAVLMVLSALFFPGGSFLFTWPLLFSLLSVGYWFTLSSQEADSIKRVIVVSVCAVPGIILVAPLLSLIFAGLPVGLYGGVVILVVLLIGLLIPHLQLVISPSKWLLPGAAASLCVVLIIAGSLASGFDKGHPKPSLLFYGLNTDTKQAMWVSTDQKPDEWTTQFFSGDAEKGTLVEFFPLSGRSFLKGQAPVASLAAPAVDLIDDSTSNGIRVLRMRIKSVRQAPIISIQADANTEVLEAGINGKRVERAETMPQAKNRNPWMLYYFALPTEGIELDLQVKPAQPISLRVIDQSYGLPEIPALVFKKRPDYMMPALFPFSDSTIVSKSFSF